MRSAELAFDVTKTFCVKAGAHECVLVLCAVFDAFPLEAFPLLALCHFEFWDLIFVLDYTGTPFATIVFVTFFATFAFAATFFGVVVVRGVQRFCVACDRSLIRADHQETSRKGLDVELV